MPLWIFFQYTPQATSFLSHAYISPQHTEIQRNIPIWSDFCKLLWHSYLKSSKIQGTYFEIQGTYFKIYALCFLRQAMYVFRQGGKTPFLTAYLLNKTIRDSRQSAHRQKARRHIAPPNRNTHDFVSFTAVKVQEIFQQEKKNIKIPTYFLRLSNKRVILFVH